MALSALMGMDSERAVPILRDVLQDRSECSADLRAEAVFILGQKMTDDAVPLMLDLAVNNPDPSDDVREAAVFALSQVRSPEATAALEQILTTSSDQDMREQALFALSQGNSPRAGQILRDYASDLFWLGKLWAKRRATPQEQGPVRESTEGATHTPAIDGSHFQCS